MKALLLKDFLLVKTQGRSGILILVLGIMFSLSGQASFVIGYMSIYFALIALGTLSYDEFENGNAFLFSLPFTRRQYVLEKYIFSFLAMLAGLFFGCVFSLLSVVFTEKAIHIESILASSAALVFSSMLLLCTMIPLRLRFGSEQGRTLSGIILGLLFAAVIIVNKFIPFEAETAANIADANMGIVWGACAVLLLCAVTASILISLRIIQKKDF